jgi:hypothetical protein
MQADYGLNQTAILELPRIEAEELREDLPSDTVSIEEEHSASGRSHDLLTVAAIVLISREVLRLLAIYIVRHFERNRTSLRLRIRDSDGSERTIDFNDEHLGAYSQSEVLHALEKAFRLQPDSNLASSTAPEQ